MGRWDCISIDLKPIDKGTFEKVENEFLELNRTESINASEFEILTATAFKIFTEKKVKFGVVEVGMGGRLDATNILQNQVVSVISKIGLDHQQYLGNTLEQIASHKAGILRPSVPYIVNRKNQKIVRSIISDHANEIGAGPPVSVELNELEQLSIWRQSTDHLAEFQKDNVLCALAAVSTAIEHEKGGVSQNKYELLKALPGMGKEIPALVGRLQQKDLSGIFGGIKLLLDGAHNLDAVEELALYLKQRRTKNITWIFAMSEGRDPRQFLSHLLQPGDNVITTEFGPVEGMPWVKATPSAALLEVAHTVEPEVNGVDAGTDLLWALFIAKYLVNREDPLLVVTGSLYLIADVFRLLRNVETGEYNGLYQSIDLGAREALRI